MNQNKLLLSGACRLIEAITHKRMRSVHQKGFETKGCTYSTALLSKDCKYAKLTPEKARLSALFSIYLN